MTASRLIAVAGVTLCVLFFVTGTPVFGILGMVVLVVLAPWLNGSERPDSP